MQMWVQDAGWHELSPLYCCAHEQTTTTHVADLQAPGSRLDRPGTPVAAQARRVHASTGLLQTAYVQKGYSPWLRHGLGAEAEYSSPRNIHTVSKTAWSRQQLRAALHVWQLGEEQQIWLPAVKRGNLGELAGARG